MALDLGNFGSSDSVARGFIPNDVPLPGNKIPESFNYSVTPLIYNPITPLNPDLGQTGLSGYSGGRNSSSEGFRGPDPWVGYRPRLCFPSELTHSKNNWMFMSFSVRLGKPGAREIYLPIPPGLTFSDSMAYSSLDLGILGSIGQDTINAMDKAKGVKGVIGAGIGGLAGSLVNKAKKLNVAAAASIAARHFNQTSIANTIDFSTKQIIAPNTNTSFQNAGIRSFGFNFKMMPKSKTEAETITAIIKTFRENMYPKGNDVVLTYPPVWSMKFYEGSGKENRKLPRIYSCYLTGMTATYNGTTNMFHSDGSPIETDVAIQFQETKALTLSDIVELSEK
jgi:hypothetical protein